jgi:predicted HNH restriction endonuclease
VVWRFDQGRLDYFNFDEIRRIACALSNIDEIKKPELENDVLRQELAKYSNRPFLPENYTVWRNYKRVFACSLLATEVDGKIVATDLCRFIANEPIDTDDYFAFFAKKFYFPSPIFENYNTTEPPIFPVSAILKYIFTKFKRTSKNFITIDEIGSILIANNITGIEPINFYENLKPKTINEDMRQIRELIRFISQFSFLKWENPNLFFDAYSIDEMYNIIFKLEPIITKRNLDPGLELLNMGSGFMSSELGDYTLQQIASIDTEFSEGSKIRVTHIRTERSTKLKEFYFKYTKHPEICNMCELDTHKKYPWTDNIIEIHHLLPLSSPARVESKLTSVQDIAGICPNCHRSVHKYYKIWLKNNDKFDFGSKEEATAVYQEAKLKVS